jgi:hypothetical protein
MEELSGIGHLARTVGLDSFPVRYSLTIREHMIPITIGTVPISGTSAIAGSVELIDDDPVFFAVNAGQRFTLAMNDGRRMDIYLADDKGTISVTGGRGFY